MVLVEVVERAKDSATLVDQVERFAIVGQVVLVFPVDTTEVDLWGSQNLLGS